MFTRFKDVDGNSFALVGVDEVSREVEAQRRALAGSWKRNAARRRNSKSRNRCRPGSFRRSCRRSGHWNTAGACIQARQVGGDYYDFLSLGRGRLGLVIGDIAGKGIAAALLMANLQANLRSQCAIALDQPQRFLRSVNQLFYQNTAESAYATLFFAEYDDRARRLRYANCGHLPGLLLRRDGALERLHSTCTVLGLFAEWDCAIGECRLLPGDTLALYTDGVTEAFNDAGEEFGDERLIEALRRHRARPSHAPSQAMVSSIIDEVRQFSPHEQYDDITLIVAQCR